MSDAFAVDTAARTVSGILLPWGEQSRLSMTKTKPVYFERGTVEIPIDPSVVTLNRNHDQFSPIGRAVALEDRPAGLWAQFAIARTPEGDRYLSDEYPRGIMKKLSAEIRGLVRDAGNNARAVAAALTGAAICTEGAFQSAALFAVDDSVEVDGVEIPAVSETSSSYETTGSDGSEYSDSATTTEEVEDLGDGKKRITRTTVTVTEIKEPDQPAEQENTVGNATVPATLAASAASLVTAQPAADQSAARDVFALITQAMKGDRDAENMLAALTNITTSGAGVLPTAGVLQPNWLGEVWKQRTYNRRYIPLIGHGDIKAIDEKGFTVTSGTEPVQPWNGNKTALPSSGGTSALISATFQRWAWAADIAREFFDIPGNEEVISAFLRLVANSYARVTDKWVLAQLVANATIVAPEAYPALDPTRDYPVAIKQLIQGVDAVSSEPIDDTAAYAVANSAAWKQIIYAPKDALPEWLTLDFGIADQAGTAGKVHVVRGDIGIDDTPAVMVGAVDSAHVNELPGASPLNLDALDIANGGVDRATVGYTQFMADYAASIVTVGTADV